jgi:hypothetical protein
VRASSPLKRRTSEKLDQLRALPPGKRSSAGWRTNWRTSTKVPANRHVGDCLENRFGPLGPTRVQIPPPPLNQTGFPLKPVSVSRCAVS